VGREFNRRMKKRFAELGIPLSFPQSLVVTPGGAPAGVVADANGVPQVPTAEPVKEASTVKAPRHQVEQ
jgi:small-conductance mechanosensitive channel